jgi:hypothetical protein
MNLGNAMDATHIADYEQLVTASVAQVGARR